MLTIKVDPHTHTFFSVHAFSTIEENALHAKERGMEAIAMTDHYGLGFMPTIETKFSPGASLNMSALPQVIHGVRILAGTEIDIADFEGNLAGHDVPGWLPGKNMRDIMLDSREITIASLHYFEGFMDGTLAQNTHMYSNVAANPQVDIIGHPIRNGVAFDWEEVLKTAKKSGCLMEVNELSFKHSEAVAEECKAFALRCAELGVPIVVGSDAHSAFFVGEFGKSLAMLDEIGFPEELVINTSLEKLMGYLAEKRGTK